MRLLCHPSAIALQKNDDAFLDRERVKGKGNGKYLVVVLDLETWRGNLITVAVPDSPRVGCERDTVVDLYGRGVDSSSISGTGFKGISPTSMSVSRSSPLRFFDRLAQVFVFDDNTASECWPMPLAQ